MISATCGLRKVSVREDGLIELDYATRTSSGTHELAKRSLAVAAAATAVTRLVFPHGLFMAASGRLSISTRTWRDRAPRKSAITSCWSREEPTG